MSGNSMINLGELSKPATVLIEKIGDAIGGLFKPYQIKRIAKAEAEAQIIDAETQIQITELHRRAMHRFVEEEAKRQANIEQITQQSLPLLEDKSKPEKIEDDWITNFFDKCRTVSDGDMQRLWASVLAGEANSPGVFSRKTVNLIADLDKSDAQLFGKLCSFGWMIGNVTPLVFDVQEKIYNAHSIDFSSLIHLESLGLIQFNNLSGFRRLGLPKQFAIFYYGKAVKLSMANDENNELELGHVLLTQAGQQLAPICGSRPVPEFLSFIIERWKAAGYAPEIMTEQGVGHGAADSADRNG